MENHYPTMLIQDICALQVPAADDAVLFLWSTAPLLPEALYVIDSWGFDYTGEMVVWDKVWIGMGYWFRGQHESLLVATRGNGAERLGESVPSVYSQTRTKHSRKPAYFRDLIGSWYPAEPKLEMFAREASPGWHVWGNEVKSDAQISNRG